MTPEEIRERADAITSRTTPDGRVNTRHVAIEQTLRERHGHPSYIADLDGPGRFYPPAPRPSVTVCGLPEDTPDEVLRALAALGAAAAEAFGEPTTVVVHDGPCPDCSEEHL